MFSYLFTFRSQTAAQSGRRILYEAGLWTQLRRAPQEVSSLGCTWGVYVEGADGVHAAQLIAGEQYGQAVGMMNNVVSHNPLSTVAGKTKFVPRDGHEVRAAGAMGISLGDKQK